MSAAPYLTGSLKQAIEVTARQMLEDRRERRCTCGLHRMPSRAHG